MKGCNTSIRILKMTARVDDGCDPTRAQSITEYPTSVLRPVPTSDYVTVNVYVTVTVTVTVNPLSHHTSLNFINAKAKPNSTVHNNPKFHTSPLRKHPNY
ncbi:hypothetical protein DsansV1_C34g0227191 [Dioscorea sansibarensis]